MEKETKLFKREKYSFKLRCWLTAREMREIKMAPYEGLDFDAKELETMVQAELLAKMQTNTENKTIEKFVVEFNENSEDILNRLLDSNDEILNDIMEEIKNISEKEEEVKKKPLMNTKDLSESEKESTMKE